MERARLGQGIEAFESRIGAEEAGATERRRKLVKALGNVMDFTRKTFGERQELVILLTGLLEHPGTSRVMEEELSEEYGKAMAFLNTDSREEALRRRLLEKEMLLFTP